MTKKISKKEERFRDMRITNISTEIHLLLDERKWKIVKGGYVVSSEKHTIRIYKKKLPKIKNTRK